MRAVIQRVQHASCTVNLQITGRISHGLLVLLGVENTDQEEDIKWLAQKIANMRIFNDENEQMNLSIKDIQGEILLISQFTLFAATKKGNRPGFTRAARPEMAQSMYEAMAKELEIHIQKTTQMGVFGTDMKIDLINDGPVTVIVDTHAKE